MNRLSCILIDDEDIAIKRLQLLISKHIEYLDVVATYNSPIEAIKGFLHYKPDIIFTDIEMPTMNGLDFLDTIRKSNIPTQAIVISAYKQPEYYEQAIKLKLVEYLIKPITSAMLVSAVENAKNNIVSKKHLELLPMLVDNLREEEKIQFKTASNGTLFERRGDIIGLEAEGRVCILFSKYQEKRRVTESFAEIEDRLLNSQFVRVGRSHIVNLKYVYEINKKNKKCIMRHEQKTIEFFLSEQGCTELAEHMKNNQ